MKSFKIPEHIRKFAEYFHKNSFSLYIVGGAVRNFYVGKSIKDYDFATDASPQQVMDLFRRTIPTGIKHGTVTVLFGNDSFEVTTFRRDGGYTDSRHPDNVEFTSEIASDLQRRDFTMNALAVNTQDGNLIDNHNGLMDIKKRLIRCIGNPIDRFNEDALRILRAFRFSAELNFSIDQNTLEAASNLAAGIIKISYERVQEELNRILLSDHASQTLQMLEKRNVLVFIIPELSACRNVGEKGVDKIDTFQHLCQACEGAPADNLILRLAALLHDVGKPTAEKADNFGNTVFHGHEKISSEISERILRRLKFPVKVIRETTHLIKHHMFNYDDNWTDSAVRRFISRVGSEHIYNLIKLRTADIYGTTGTRRHNHSDNLIRLVERVNSILAENAALTIADLDINGNDLIHLGITKGPALGTILELLLETILDDPEMNNKETLKELALNMYQNYRLSE